MIKNTIHLLSKDTYEKIAAGEVIERPASIIRELLDNALDAQANNIKINLIDGGKTLIQVQDNGIGMNKNDLLICYYKYSTSKIKDFKDLSQTISMGFRGEALHAISIISELSISSKSKLDSIGYSILIKGGNLIDKKILARQNGSTVKISNLFYNIPARKKALKSDASEWQKIKEIVINKTIPFYECDIFLANNSKIIYQSSKSNNLKNRLELFWGKENYKHLIYVEKEFKEFNINAYFSEVNYFKTNKKYQLFYINKRPIFSAVFLKSISKAYENICPKGQYPLVILFITCDPQFLDVNIHPTKHEIKFFYENIAYQAIYNLISQTILKKTSFPKIDIKNHKNKSIKIENNNNKIQSELLKNNSKKYSTTKNSNISQITTWTNSKNYKILGLLFKTYIVIEYQNELIIIDQHAAHERILYEDIKNKLKLGKIESQRLLTELTINLPILEIQSEKLKNLLPLGFEIELFGKYSYIIRSIPYFLKIESIKITIEKMLHLLYKNNLPSSLEFINNIIITKSCKLAIKSGDELTQEELIHLIEKWFIYSKSFSCPHGRPTAIKFLKKDLEKFFLRKK